MAEKMQAECKQDNVVDYVHENCVDRRASHSPYVPGSDPKEEGVGQRRRVDVHCRKQRSHYEQRKHEAHVPVQPGQQEPPKEDFLKYGNEQASAKNRDYPCGRTLTLETFGIGRHSGQLF